MSLATAAQIRFEGNLTDAIIDSQLTNHIATAERMLKSYLSEDVYEGIVQADDSTFTAYESDFSAGADGFDEIAAGTDLVVTGNNDSILGRDNVLKMLASNDVNFRIQRAATTPEGGKVYKLRFDYFAEEDSGVNYLGTEISESVRGRDQYGNFAGVRVIEESWQIAEIMTFQGSGALNITGYGNMATETIANLAKGKAIYMVNMKLEFLDDLSRLTAAENMWALAIALPALAIHTAGGGITLQGGAADGSYTFISHAQAAAMGRRFTSKAKSLVAQFVSPLDLIGDGRNQVLATGVADFQAI